MFRESMLVAALNVLVWFLSFAPVFYIVFWMGHSGWWFALSFAVALVGTHSIGSKND